MENLNTSVSNLVTLYKPQSLYRLSILEAFVELKRLGRFKLFLEFIDPRTDKLVQDYFEFFTKPQPSYSGGGFIVDYMGLTLRVSSDMNWYSRYHDKGMQYIPQKCGCIVEGEYQNMNFKLGVSPHIRVAYDAV